MRTVLGSCSFLWWLQLLGLGVPLLAGCGGAPGIGSGSKDVLSSEERAEADDADVALAREVEAVLAGPSASCTGCHEVTRAWVAERGRAMLDLEAACFAPPDLTARQRVDCLRSDPALATSPFSPGRLGLYAAGASSQSFADLFNEAFGPAQGRTQFASFRRRVSMPLGGEPIPAADFEKVKAWVLRGMPALDQVFDTPVDPGACVDSLAPELLEHIAKMKTDGWGARLAELSTPMFGCGAATSALECLADRPDVTAEFGGPEVAQGVRQLYSQPLASSFWVRSSADGRYVGLGLGGTSHVVDLSRPDVPIRVDAPFDPYFFPNNDGFAFAGTSGGITACRQSLLDDVASAPAPSISMTEPKCASVGSSVYQSVGSALDDVRYFMTLGPHTNDNGGRSQTTALSADFGPGAATQFVPMVNDGQSYRSGTPVSVALPGEGDAMLSPSSLLVGTRFARADGQSAMRIRLVKATGEGEGLSVEAPLAAEICAPGAKVGFSFDERFLVTHQYVDHADPAQASLPIGSSNVVLVDLKTGARTLLTRMAAGRYALYPHFRADGWLYFLVRDMNANLEFVLATDAALRVAE
jgi:hypothetical protein